MCRQLILILFILFSFESIAQENGDNPLALFNAFKLMELDGKHVLRTDYFNQHITKLRGHENYSFENTKIINGSQGMVRYKYQQFYKNIPVAGGIYTLHERKGRIVRGTGNVYPNITLNTTPKYTYQEIVQALEVPLVASMKSHDYQLGLESGHFEFENLGLRIVDEQFPNFSGNYKLAYLIVASSNDGPLPIREEVYVDANNLKIINHFPKIHLHDVKGKIKTYYYGEQEITLDSMDSDRYLLHDETRGLGITTIDGEGETFEHNSKNWDLTNENFDQVAGDAHYGATSFFDMMNNMFAWEGIDGEGGELISAVHARGRYYVNAFWNGTTANFGNGDCDRYSPLTTLEIIAHEFTHGVTDYTSDLIYRNESGALNESISDIFGKALEYFYNKENFDWLIGGQIRKTEDVDYFRSMEDPTLRNHPKFYAGDNWRTSSSDNGGVHSNSGVFNHWFYLLVEGGNGTNELNENFNVQAIGMEKALQIVFSLQTGFLTENSTYFDAFYYSLSACSDLFGENSNELISVIESWKAVGLYQGINDIDLSLELPSNEIASCPDSDVFSNCIIINVGRTALKKGSEISIYLSQKGAVDNVNATIALAKDMEVGDTILYEFDSPFLNDISNSGKFEVGINVENEVNILNNIKSGDFQYSEIEGVDLVLENISFSTSDRCTSAVVNRFSFTIRNIGCEAVNVGETLFFDVRTDKGDFSISRNLFLSSNPGDLQTSSIGILGFGAPESFSQFDVTLRYDNDLNESNNNFSGTKTITPRIENGYKENFEDDSSSRLFDIVKSNFYNMDTVINYRGNNMLALFGLKDHSFFRNCELHEDFFDSYSFKSSIRFCVNAMDMTNPIFEFNSMMYRNENGIAELLDENYAVMFRVIYDEFTSEVFKAQPEGAMINYQFALPENFQGEFEIEALTLSKNEINLNSGFIEEKDMLLFDDFRLFDLLEDQREIIKGGYSIYPNPTSNIIRIKNENKTQHFDIRVYNSIGMLVYLQKEILNQDWIDVSGIPNGVYVISIFENGKNVSQSKFIKVN